MTLSRANPSGWALNEILTSAQANAMDLEIVKALDGDGGGTYTPTARLRVSGDEGFGLDGLFDTEGFSPVFGLQNWNYGLQDGLPASTQARGFTYSPVHRVWVLVGDQDAAAISYDDGITWIADSSSMASTVALEDVANSRANDRWVAVGDSATAYTRSGLGAWSTSALPGTPEFVHGVFYDDSNDLFVAIGRKTGPTPYLATSSGTGVPSWTDRSATIVALTNFGTEDLKSGVSNESGISVVAATAASKTKVIFSTDGTTWAESTTSLVGDLYAVGYNPGVDKFMAYGTSFDNVYTSTDGDTWTLVDSMIEFDTAPLEPHRMIGSLGKIWIIGGEISNAAAIAYSLDDFDNPTGWRVQMIAGPQEGLLAMGFPYDGVNGKALAGVDNASTSTIYGTVRGSAM